MRTRRLWLYGAMLASAVGAVVSLVRIGPAGGVMAVAWFYLPFLALIVMCGEAWRRWTAERRALVEADDRGLTIDGRLEVARDGIRAAHVHRRDGATIVRLVRTFRPVDVVVEDEIEGEALIAALRLDAASAVAKYMVQDGTHARSAGRVGIIAAVFVVLIGTTTVLSAMSHSFLGLSAVVPMLVAYLVLLVRGQLTLSVGGDGVRLQRWLGEARFVRYADIKGVRREGGNVFLDLRDGRTLAVSKGLSRKWAARVGGEHLTDEVDGLVARLNQRIDAHERGDDAAVVATLARAGRTTAQWLRDLTSANETQATFRTPAIPRDVLWSVVEDTSAPTSVRVGAAVALRSTLDDAARTRLRIAADACAAPRLRVAMERASSTQAEDEDALSAALDPIEDEPQARPAKALPQPAAPGAHQPEGE